MYINDPISTKSLKVSIGDSLVISNLKGIISLGKINNSKVLLDEVYWLPIYKYYILSLNKLIKEDKCFNFNIINRKGLEVSFRKDKIILNINEKENIIYIKFNSKEFLNKSTKVSLFTVFFLII